MIATRTTRTHLSAMGQPFPAILFLLSLLQLTGHGQITLTEFLARGEDRWIELYHAGSDSVDLAGYALRFSKDGETLVFSHRTLEADSYTVIRLGKDPGELDIELKRDDGDLTLLDPAGTPVTVYRGYPEQRDGVSYGLLEADGIPRYFTQPTPGRPNIGGYLGFVVDTKFSINGGIHEAPFSLEITSKTPDVDITYTTDGSVPGLFNTNTKRYQGPITIDQTTLVRALASKWDHVPTNLDTHTYLFLADVLDQPEFPEGFPTSWGEGPGVTAPMPGLTDYAMDQRIREAVYEDMEGEAFTLADALQALPSLSLVMPIKTLLHPKIGLHALARNKGREWERPMSLELFDETGRRAFQVDGGFRMQGGWNRFPESLKKSFRFYFRSQYGDAKLDYPLFPDSGVRRLDTFILRSGNGKVWSSPWRPLTGSTNNSLERTTYLRDQLPRDLQRDMGHPTSHGRFVHLYINGLYWGLYNLVERVDKWFGPAYLGGDEDEYDVIKWIRSEGMVISDGNAGAWNELLGLARGNVQSPETYEAVVKLLDLENLIDYMLINFTIGNTDWPDNNSYTFRRRSEDGRFRFVCWDSEESLVTAQANVLGTNNATTAAELFQRLLGNPEFRVLLMDRIHKHFSPGGVLTDEHVHARFMERAREIDRAIVAESARWGDLMRPSQPYTRAHWLRELENLEQHFFGLGQGSREKITLEQMKAAGWTSSVSSPLLAPEAGFVPRGSAVRLMKKTLFTTGDIHATTDGSDPRLPGGEVNPSAQKTAGEITVGESMTIKARLYVHGRWGPLAEGHYSIGEPATSENLIITELMYHPAAEEDPEFLELSNPSASEVNLLGAYFDEGIRFHFQNDTVLQPGEQAILTNDHARFKQRYGDAIRVLGEFSEGTRLSNGGETVTLRAASGEIIALVDYDDEAPWPEAADGNGYSLVADGTKWRSSTVIGGTPGFHDHANMIETTLTLAPTIMPGSNGHHLVIDRWADANEVAISVEISRDLENWSILKTSPEIFPAENKRVRMQWALPVSAEMLYARVRIGSLGR